METLLFIAGGIVSWFFTHIYYHRSTNDQEKIFSKMSEELKNTILSSKADNLTIEDLNDLINKQTIDYEDMKSGDPLPYKACPKCGSNELKKGTLEDSKRDELYYAIECIKCGWNDWTQ
ncbi:MAG: hypothetical protein ABIA75_05040 [Candidatus Neomarinimicrobiota bacterium]